MRTARLAAVAALSALGIVLSLYPGSIPVGPTKVFFFQSMINAIAGVLLGPWYAALVALLVGIGRMSLGTGTIYSIPGGIPGALLVGYCYRLTKRDEAAFAEIPGTGLIGALLSAYLVAPNLSLIAPYLGIRAGSSVPTATFFVTAFTTAAVLGSILGYLILTALRRRGVLARLPL